MSYSSVVLADSPTAYWRLGEPSGTTAEDETTTHDGTYVNTPTFGVTGPLDDGNTAVTFNGTDERVDTTTLGTLGGSILSASFEYWINTTTTSTIRAPIGTINTGSALIVHNYLNCSAAEGANVGTTMFGIRGQNGQTMRGSISTNIYDGAWHHVVFVVENGTTPSTFSAYVDGSSVTVTYDLQQTITAANFDFALMIGARNNRGTADRYCPATLDEVAVYPTRLTSGQVAGHYAARVTSDPPSLYVNTPPLRW
jgi:hypothetical protein